MKKTRSLTISALLIALGITIPMFMPKVIIPPASYTLASHVPVFIAMFISPMTAVSVALGTALGFLITTTPEIAARALSHVIFAWVGSQYIRKHPGIIHTKRPLLVFNLVIALIHASAEVLAITPFYLNNPLNASGNYWMTIILMVGLGGLVHSIIDFLIAQTIVKRTINMIR